LVEEVFGVFLRRRECTHTQRERERATVRSAMDEGHGEGEGEGETSFLLAGLGTQKPTVI
jgi:hypothetical protein